ncbi:MAG: lysophospholipid acyltransferase family protein [Planctomycetota bacterium]|jgi:putative hemolysin
MSTETDPRRPLRLPDRFDDPVRRGLVRLVRPTLERVLCFPQINDTYQALHESVTAGETDADDKCQRLLEILGVRVAIDDADQARIPDSGPLVVVANHPFGGIEGIILGALLRRVRPDARLMANHLLSNFPLLHDQFIFVDPFDRADSIRRNLASMRDAVRHVREGGALGVFPAGEVAHVSLRRMRIAEVEWSETIARIIARTEAPVLPVFFDGQNSVRFHLAGLVHPRLRTLLLPRELFRLRDCTVRVAVGNLIEPARLRRFDSPRLTMAYLRARTSLLRGRLPSRRPVRAVVTSATEPIAPAVAPETLAAEVEALPDSCRLLRLRSMHVLCAPAPTMPALLREIGRLREETFRAVGEGTGKALDLDRFDGHYHHLFVWNEATSEIVGAYRLGPTDEILPRLGVRGLYTRTLFRYSRRLMDQIGPALELGRSWVRAEYQRHHAPLMLLWKGIGTYTSENPRYRMLFGPVSISNEYHSMSKQLLVAFLQSNRYLSGLSRVMKPINPVRFARRDRDVRDSSVVVEDLDEVDVLIREIEADRRGVPILLRQYLKLNSKLLGFNVDPEFGDVVDGLMLTDLAALDERALKFYMGVDRARAFLEYHKG